MRGQIDEADRELVAALVKRYNIVRQVVAVKAVYQTIMDEAKKLEK
ncbi:MAG: chorismate mutase [Lacticaseibacillus absianus]